MFSSSNYEVVNVADKTNPAEIVALLVWHQVIDQEYLEQFDNLRMVQRYGVGFDNIDISACEQRRIVFCNNPDYGVEEVSNTALAQILFLARGLGQYQSFVNELIMDDDNTIWQQRVGTNIPRLSERTLLVVGAGRIGTALIRKSKELFQEVIIFDPGVPTGFEKALGCKRVSNLREGVSGADYISLNCFLDEKTRGIVDEDFLSACKPTVCIANTARGGLFANDDLILEAVCDGRIWGLATDVFNHEPPSQQARRLITQLLKSKPGQLLLTNHTAFFSEASIIELRANAARNVHSLLTKNHCENKVSICS